MYVLIPVLVLAPQMHSLLIVPHCGAWYCIYYFTFSEIFVLLTYNPVTILAPVHVQLPLGVDEDSRLITGNCVPFFLLIEGEVTKIFAMNKIIF